MIHIKATVTLEAEGLFDVDTHDKAKSKLIEALIRKGHQSVKINHANSEVVEEEEIDLHVPALYSRLTDASCGRLTDL